MTERRSLTILQYNIRGELGTITALLNDPIARKADVLAIQEPWQNVHTKSSYNPGNSGFFLSHKGEIGTRVCLYINKRIDVDSWEETFPSKDVCAIVLKLKGESANVEEDSVQILNVYNPSPSLITNDNPSSLPVLATELQQQRDRVVLGDFNLHHPNWNNHGRFSYHKESDELLEMTVARSMDLALPEDSVTWRARGSESTIDLIFTSPKLTEAVVSCRVRPDLQVGSDHLPVYTELDLTAEETVVVHRRAWKTAKQEAVRAALRELAYTLRPNRLETEVDVDEHVKEIMAGLEAVVDKTVPWAKPSDKARSFWNQECAEATRVTKQLAVEYQENRSDHREEKWREAIKARNKAISKAKTLDFRRGVHEAGESQKGIWGLAKWARQDSMNPKPLPKFPALKRGDTTMARSFEDKVGVLRKTFFPPPPQADLSDIDNAIYPGPIGMDSRLTEKEVRTAIFRPKQDKAPGIDGMPNRFLRMVAGELLPQLTRLFQACIDLGYHPREFKTANTIVLRKPGKDDYSEPKSYRPIALLSTMGKALEAVIAKRLSDCAEEYDLLPPEQMGARRGRSTETALETIVNAVYTVWDCGKKNVASLLSLDIAGAFDNVSYGRLLHNLRAKGVPTWIVR